MRYFEDIYPRFFDGSLTPRDFLEDRVRSIEENESSIHAFAALDIQAARAQADESTRRYREGQPLSSLDGMPIGIKDIISTATLPTRMNSPLYKDYQPVSDAACVRALKRAGCVIVGKTATTELAIGEAANTRNPWNTDCTPGGSSSGAAAAVAANMLTASLATQTQGSIIRPASYCGIFGFKPTWGRLSLEGIHPVSPSHDHLGLIAQDAETAWAIAQRLSVAAPAPLVQTRYGLGAERLPDLRPRKLALLRPSALTELDEASLKVFNDNIEYLRSLGIEVVDADDDNLLRSLSQAFDDMPELSTTIVAYEMQSPYASYVEYAAPSVGDRIHQWLEKSSSVSLEGYVQALEVRDSLSKRYAEVASQYDAFILPSSSGPAPSGLKSTGSRSLQVYASFLGLPACSIPQMTVENLPLGCQLLGRKGEDYNMMGIAKWIEGHRR